MRQCLLLQRVMGLLCLALAAADGAMGAAPESLRRVYSHVGDVHEPHPVHLPAWIRHEGRSHSIFPRRSPGAKVPWEYQANRPDTDHFNRDFKPDAARGGVQIWRLDPGTGRTTSLTPEGPGVWDFRASASDDGRSIVFYRAETGGLPGLWVMDAEGRHAHLLTRGIDDQGADHPRWLPGGRVWKSSKDKA